VASEPLRLSGVAATLRLWAYVLLQRHEPLPRKHIAFHLWPDSTEDDALAHLRRQLYLLQQLLPPAADECPWLVTDRLTAQWNPDSDYRLDVDEFEALCSETGKDVLGRGERPAIADLERAVALYTGDLLSDFYDDWVLTERERLSQVYGQALTRLLGFQAIEGDPHAAVATAARLVSHDNLCEEAHRLVISLHYLAGDRAAALHAYDECRHVLTRELDVEPMPQTVHLADAIRASEPAERILRLIRPDLPATTDLGALVSGKPPHNLPCHLTSFVGREREMTEVTSLLTVNRLLTLTGPGGCGKTRLALEVAGEILGRGDRPTGADETAADGPACPSFPDGAWWVDLAPLEDPALVPQAVAKVLGVREEPGAALIDLLEGEVRPKAMLLVLDNSEGVIEVCATLSQRLLSASPALRVLATSREPFGVAGEMTWPVPPLSVPPEEDGHTVGEVMRYEAPQLLLDRARLCRPEFCVSDDEAADVAAVCQQLDGIPLAIELAAAQVTSFSVAQISEHLDDRFRLLSGGGRTALPRHQTLRAAIDWSYELLTEPECRLLRRLGVFRGGWTLVSAEAVCADDGIERDYIPVLLTSLAAKSLVVVGAQDGARRYRMLDTIRQYARDRLIELREVDRVRARHLSYFLALAEEAEPELRGPNQAEWLGRLAGEHDNLRAALAWSSTHESEAEIGLRLAGALRWYWYMRSHLTEGRRWLERALESRPTAPADLRAKVLNAAGNLAHRQGDYASARALFEDCLATRRQAGDERGVGLVLGNLGLAALDQADYASARSCFGQSLAILEEFGDKRGVANALGNLGLVSYHEGDYASAQTSFERNLALLRELGDHWSIAASLSNLARVAGWREDYETAGALYEEALSLYRELGDKGGTADVLNDLGSNATWQGNHERARRLFGESLAVYRELGLRSGIAASLGHLGQGARMEGDLAQAAELLSESLALYREQGHQRGISGVLLMLGEVAGDAGEPARAARLWGTAQLLREMTGLELPPAGQADYDRNVAAAKAQLDEVAFDRAWEEGRAMTVEEAVEYALGEMPERSEHSQQ